MVDATYQPKVYLKQGGEELVVQSGGKITVEAGGAIEDSSGAKISRDLLTIDIADMSADASKYLVSPSAGTLSKIHVIVDGPISTADLVVTAKMNGTAFTGSAVTLSPTGSTAGTKGSSTPSKSVAANDVIELAVSGGGAGGSPSGRVILVIDR